MVCRDKAELKLPNRALWRRPLLTVAEQGAQGRDGALLVNCDYGGGPAVGGAGDVQTGAAAG